MFDLAGNQVLADAAPVGGQHADHLGHVHGRATADANDDVAFLPGVLAAPGVDATGDGVG